MNLLKKYNVFVLLVVAFATAFDSCVDDKLPGIDEDPDNPRSEDQTVLTFRVNLETDPTSRAGWNLGESVGANTDATKYEDYIDTQDKFRVFFFTEEGEFLFGAIDRTISVAPASSATYNVYTVRVPMNLLVDRQGNEYDVEAIKNYLRTHDFKIAILANWPNAGAKVNPGDYDDGDTSDSFTENPSSTLKGHPLWGVKNSVLYTGPDKDVKTINNLHHLYNEENGYASTVSTGERASNFDCYSPFMSRNDDGLWAMGEPTDWVKMRDVEEGWHANYSLSNIISSFDSKETANQWIRQNWNPNVELNNEKGIYRHYQHMWFLWNFDASFKYGLYRKYRDTDRAAEFNSYASAYNSNYGWDNGLKQGIANPWGQQWYVRNGRQFFEDWMEGHYSTDNPLGSVLISNIGTNGAFFSFNKFENNKECYVVANRGATELEPVNYGVRLPSRGEGVVSNSSEGVFSFQARTTGTLRIKWGNASNENSATLCVQKGNGEGSPTGWTNRYSIASGNRYKLFEIGGTSQNISYLDIATGDKATPIYIYCSRGTAIIYAIEYIRGKYLYETDREGVIPSPNQGIPMYGIQEFEALSDWEDGTTINIRPKGIADDDPDIKFKLLRSVAKIEVYIPDTYERPRHMYMRGMNRAARCEPMDVENPIDWPDDNASGGHNTECEFFKLQKHGPAYQESSRAPSTEQIQEYRDWLAWFYGSWSNWFNFNNQVTPSDLKGEGYPKIFNPYIERSEFCHLIYMGTSDGYHKYVMYMPEKYIDDPTYTGNLTSFPVVPHLEYRFNPDPGTDDVTRRDSGVSGIAESPLTNSEYNLEDDNCYRIYFTNYGQLEDLPKNNNITKVFGQDSYDDYEQSRTNLTMHWPIMRNHTYSFYVNGSAPEVSTLHVKITDWKHEKVVVEW